MSKNIYVQEEFVNESEGYRLGDSDVFESRFTSKSEAWKHYRREYGRCISKVYIGEDKPIGWVFQKLVKYTDCNEKYLQSAWVTLHAAPPVRSIEYNYL